MSSIRPVAAVMLAGSLGLVAACGSSSSGGQATQLKTAAEATTFANTVNLKTTDLPGFKASPADKDDAATKKQDQELAACAGGVDPSKDLVDLSSDDFDRGSDLSEQEISSDTTVLPTTAEVKQDLTALTSAKGQSCLQTELGKFLAGDAGDGVTVGAPTIKQSALTVPGSQGAFKDEVTLTLTAQSQKFTAFIDVLGFTQGQAEVELTTSSIGSPFDAATEQKLAALLADRAQGNTKATPPSIPPAASGAATS